MQLVDERCHRHHFTERNSVDPDDWSVWFVWFSGGLVCEMDQKDQIDQTDYFLIPAVGAILDDTVVWRAAPQE